MLGEALEFSNDLKMHWASRKNFRMSRKYVGQLMKIFLQAKNTLGKKKCCCHCIVRFYVIFGLDPKICYRGYSGQAGV